MRHASLVAVLLGALSCKQACGLEDITPDGSGGNGGDGDGGVGGGPSCTPPIVQNVCSSAFAMIPDCFGWDACTNPGVDGPEDCGEHELLADTLVMTPAPGTGYWNNMSEAMFLHTAVPEATTFVAWTTVRSHRAGLPDAWPNLLYSLAGLVVRQANVESALDSGNWIKAEYGTLGAQTSQGLRVARKTGPVGVAPGAENIRDDDTTFHPPDASDVQIALCRTGDWVIHAYFREAGAGPWVAVEPEVNQNLPQAVHVGIVSAATTGGDMVGEFREIAIEKLPVTATVDDCRCYLDSL